tara:strand:+ start:394 stop:744 length:351 start_codon:yes stop_codon:yes gene_type:complete
MKHNDNKIITNISSFLEEKKAWNIKLIDVREISTISDFFIIANGSNIPHLKALFEGLYLFLKKQGFNDIRKNGLPESGWMILDVYGIMIHLFDNDIRDFYDLEGLWRDAPITNIGE